MLAFINKFINLHSRRSTQKGLALIGITWLTTLLGILAIGAIQLTKANNTIVINEETRNQAEALADAATYITIENLCNGKNLDRMPVDGNTRTITFNNHDVIVLLQDEFGKIDINFAPSILVTSYLQKLLLPDSAQLQALQYGSNLENGDEPPRVQSSLRRHNYRSLDELRLTMNTSNTAPRDLTSSVTVYTQQGEIRTWTANHDVLVALPGMSEAKVNEILLDRQQKKLTVASLRDLDSTSGSGRQVYTIISTAKMGNSIFKRRAVVRLTGDTLRPYGVLDWGTEEAH